MKKDFLVQQDIECKAETFFRSRILRKTRFWEYAQNERFRNGGHFGDYRAVQIKYKLIFKCS